MNATQGAMYARVSSEQQAEAHTVARQGAALRERVCGGGPRGARRQAVP